MSRYLPITIASLSSLLIASDAFAGAFAVREQSAWYQGLSFAGNATVSKSLSSMYWNPATMTGHDGVQVETSQTFVFPRATIDLDTATIDALGIPVTGVPYSSGDIGVDAWVPAGYGTWKINDRLTLGVSSNAPYGFETKPQIEWAGQVYARSSRVLSVNVTPMAAYEVTEKFSVGVGWQLQYLQVRLKSATGVPPIAANSPTAELRGEDYNLGFGATLGALFKPWEGTQLGIGYRSPIEHNLKGRLVVGGGTPTPIRSNIIMPETVTVSFQQVLNERWRGMGTFEWTHWSRFSTFPVFNLQDQVVSELPFQYNDGYFISLGTEYDFTQNITGRFGLAYEWSPIDEANRTPRLPDSNRFWLSAGVSYFYEDWLEVDFGYSHIFPESSNININPDHPFYEGITIQGPVNDTNVDIISFGARLKF
ncbi:MULTISPECIES: OmpP1/FadL family transporter [unclassified Pseudovibrio]|uniref:OmpP1/FadL family transporter n=1 Tax=unclassified Pseudovibrio TaxID=2627060 RepID=UPI0007AEBD41|nr:MULTISPECIES: OmpP1/FadL family transporter [unclassified Pseudovibrio]KZK93231.1 47 kDa outer membrane protein precursor [Pseudovibrio sp. W74]KZL07122.1 47 kDa outer membrane protein precursor [Pseudovibrio sp. Ad14]